MPPPSPAHFGNVRFRIHANADVLFPPHRSKHSSSPLTRRGFPGHAAAEKQRRRDTSQLRGCEMKISVKHLFTLVLRAETEKPAERGQGSIMPSNKFICWEVVKRGRGGGQGVLCLSAQQEIEISLRRNREVSGWPAQGGGASRP